MQDGLAQRNTSVDDFLSLVASGDIPHQDPHMLNVPLQTVLQQQQNQNEQQHKQHVQQDACAAGNARGPVEAAYTHSSCSLLRGGRALFVRRFCKRGIFVIFCVFWVVINCNALSKKLRLHSVLRINGDGGILM